MKKYLVLIILVLYGLIFLFISCDKYPTQSDSPYGRVVLANNLKIIDNIRGIDLYGINSQSGVYTFKIEDNYNTIVVGDIILGTASGGYIRKVIGRKRDKKILELETEDATLADVIINGGTDTTLYLSVGTASKESNFEVVSAAKGVSISENGIDLTGLSLYSGTTEGVTIDVDIVDGFVSFDPKVEYGFGFNSRGFDKYHSIISGVLNYNYNMEISANGKFGMTGLKNIADLRYTFIQMIDSVPLLEVVNLKLDIGFVISATIDGTFSSGDNAEYDVIAGMQFEKGNISEIWSYESEFRDQPLNWQSRSKKHIQSYIRPRVIVNYYSTTSSQITFETYKDFNAVADNNPFWCWDENNGIRGNYSFAFPVFGSDFPGYKKDYEQQQWPMDSDCENIEDQTSPLPITDLVAGNPTDNSITLTWTSTGDDGAIGKASEYDIRYSTSPIDSINWAQATKCSPTPNPQIANNLEEYVVTGLVYETDYYFALKAADEVLNWSPISNIAMSTTDELADIIRPSPISDLFAGSPTATSLTLTWTAPGDDNYTGTAAKYDIRISTEYITPYQWGQYPALQNSIIPGPSGSDEEYLVTNLVPNTIYYFAIKSADEVSNWSDMSNMAGERTALEMARGDILGEFESPVSTYTLDIAAADSSLWIINIAGDTIYNVDLSDGTIKQKLNFAQGENSTLRGIAFDGNNLWVAASGNIYKIDPENGNQLGHFIYNQQIESAAGLTWGNNKLWLAGPYSDKAYEIDTERALLDGNADSSITNQIIFTNPPSLRGILYYDGGLFISAWTNSEAATVIEYDTNTGEIRQQFQIKETNPPHNPIQGGLATDGTYFYSGGDNLRILKIRY